MYSRSEKNTHDRARGTIRESSRKNFFGERKDIEHELTENQAKIKKLLNDGFCFESVTRNDNRYEVHFVNPKTDTHTDCIFNYEANFNQLQSTLHLTSGHEKHK